MSIGQFLTNCESVGRWAYANSDFMLQATISVGRFMLTPDRKLYYRARLPVS